MAELGRWRWCRNARRAHFCERERRCGRERSCEERPYSELPVESCRSLRGWSWARCVGLRFDSQLRFTASIQKPRCGIEIRFTASIHSFDSKPRCGIEIRLVHLSTCDEAGPATSGRPGRGFVHRASRGSTSVCERAADPGTRVGSERLIDPILCRSHAFPAPARRIRWFGFVRTRGTIHLRRPAAPVTNGQHVACWRTGLTLTELGRLAAFVSY